MLGGLYAVPWVELGSAMSKTSALVTVLSLRLLAPPFSTLISVAWIVGPLFGFLLPATISPPISKVFSIETGLMNHSNICLSVIQLWLTPECMERESAACKLTQVSSWYSPTWTLEVISQSGNDTYYEKCQSSRDGLIPLLVHLHKLISGWMRVFWMYPQCIPTVLGIIKRILLLINFTD